MSLVSDKNKNVPDSQVVFLKKRLYQIEGFAQTKFGNSLVTIKVDRENELFIIIVKDAKEQDVKDFELLWKMCKVESLISVNRKK